MKDTQKEIPETHSKGGNEKPASHSDSTIKNLTLPSPPVVPKPDGLVDNSLQHLLCNGSLLASARSEAQNEFLLSPKHPLSEPVTNVSSHNNNIQIQAKEVQSNSVLENNPEVISVKEPANSVDPTIQAPLSDEEVLQRTRSLWREVEPTDLSDPVEHTEKRIKKGIYGEVTVGASRRGRSHAHDGKYREDFYAISGLNHGFWLLWLMALVVSLLPALDQGLRLSQLSIT